LASIPTPALKYSPTRFSKKLVLPYKIRKRTRRKKGKDALIHDDHPHDAIDPENHQNVITLIIPASWRHSIG